MQRISPEVVLASVSKDLKARHLTQEKVAELTGYKSRQAIALILKSQKYMNEAQAKAFHDSFGYYEGFLTRGEGSLMSEEPAPLPERETMTVFPKMLLELRPFENKESFQEAFDSLIDGIVLEYGQQAVRKFARDCYSYLLYFVEPSDYEVKGLLNRFKLESETEEEYQKKRNYLFSEEYQQLKEARMSRIMDNLYRQYSIMTEER